MTQKVLEKSLILLESYKIHHPIARQALSLFKNAGNKVVVKHQNKQKTIEIHKNILAELLAYTVKTGRTIDFRGALTFPLSPLPLSPTLMELEEQCRKVN